MKHYLKMLAAFALASCCSVSQAAPTLVGNATLNTANDLTVIADGATTYQFLDFTTTLGKSQQQALSLYGASGFHVGTSDDVTRLFNSFGFEYATPGNFTPVTATLAQESAFLSYLGTTFGNASLASYRDLNVGNSYLCVSTSTCGPNTFVRNVDLGSNSLIGIVLVRDVRASDVPEPASIALLGLSLAGLAFARRNNK